MKSKRAPKATSHRVLSHSKWVAARKKLLTKEKAFSRAREALALARRKLPWERVEKGYVFHGPKGAVPLAELFDGRRQLVVYHFMFDPEWKDGCKICSFWADQFERNIVHLKARDVTMVAISRAPLSRINPYKKRMGWTFPWLSSQGSDFNFDYQASCTPEELKSGEAYYNYQHTTAMGETPGISVFYKDATGAIFHTYSCYARGMDMMNTAYQYLDLVPRGRDEARLEWPMAWVRRRDSYPR